MKIPILVAIVVLFQAVICLWMVMLLRKAHTTISYKPFWQAFQTGVAKSLHHPHPESGEMDDLLEELENLTITVNGTKRLKVLLREKARDTNQSPEERNLAEFLLFAMPMVIKEREGKK
jgi:hypothetical protein